MHAISLEATALGLEDVLYVPRFHIDDETTRQVQWTDVEEPEPRRLNTGSSLLLVVRHLLLEAMHLFLVASCF